MGLELRVPLLCWRLQRRGIRKPLWSAKPAWTSRTRTLADKPEYNQTNYGPSQASIPHSIQSALAIRSRHLLCSLCVRLSPHWAVGDCVCCGRISPLGDLRETVEVQGHLASISHAARSLCHLLDGSRRSFLFPRRLQPLQQPLVSRRDSLAPSTLLGMEGKRSFSNLETDCRGPRRAVPSQLPAHAHDEIVGTMVAGNAFLQWSVLPGRERLV